MVLGRANRAAFKDFNFKLKFMATQIEAKCRLCRREGEKLYLKGDKCFTTKCPIISRNYIPGQHGPVAKRSRISEYGMQLREKQKVKRVYGVLENKFEEYVQKAAKNPAETGDALLKILEQRLDNAVFRLGFAPSRRQARQMIGHGHILVNNKKLTIPSYQIRVGDIISLKSKWSEKKDKIKEFEELAKRRGTPEWLSRSENEGKVEATPDIESLKGAYNIPLIIEFYSR